MAFKNLEQLEAELKAIEAVDRVSSGIEGEAVSYPHFVGTLAKDMGSRENDLMHMAVGIAGEAGELLDAIKKYWAYGKPLDLTNVIEELGDLEFYMQGMRLLIGVSRQEILGANFKKLHVRYGDSYSDEKAIARADKEPQEVAKQVIDVTSAEYKRAQEWLSNQQQKE